MYIIPWEEVVCNALKRITRKYLSRLNTELQSALRHTYITLFPIGNQSRKESTTITMEV